MLKMSLDEYLKHDALSRSDIRAFIQGPNYWRWFKQDKKKTKSMAFGTYLHWLALEPEEFRKNVVIKPQGLNLVTKDGITFKKNNEGKAIISDDEYNKLNAMAASIMNHPEVLDLYTPGNVERSFFYQRDGVNLKCRPDFFSMNDVTIVDIKTTSKPLILRKLAYEIRNRGYDIQGAMCLDGLSDYFKHDFKTFLLVFVESNPPYDVMVVELDRIDIERARNEYLNAIREWKICKEKNEWPSRIAKERHKVDLTFVDMELEENKEGEAPNWL